jgi:adenylylsulfate kinase
MNQEIKIRYNTEKDKTDPTLPAWRVLISGVEHLAEAVELLTPCWTSQDEIAPGLIKWHISCRGNVVWNGKVCKIEPPTKPGVIWLTGLPAAGKSTLGKIVAKRLRDAGVAVEELDGDAIRSLFPSTGFSREERELHIRRVGFMASRLEAHGVTVVASLISPFEESRGFIRSLCKNYFEVYVSTPLEVCEERDPKGHYKKARAGLLPAFTGVDAPYEVPKNPHLKIDTQNVSSDAVAEKILEAFFRL